MSETKAIRIASVKYEREYSLRIRWVNGKTMSVDLQQPVSRLEGMRPLRDKSAFARAGKGEGGHSVVWPYEIDMGADRLWEMALEQSLMPTPNRVGVGYVVIGLRPRRREGDN